MNQHAVALPLVILAVSDLEYSARFYQRALTLTWQVDESFYKEALLEKGMRLGLYQRQGFGANTGCIPVALKDDQLTGSELYLVPQDWQHGLESMEQAGAVCLRGPEPKPWGDEVAYFRDPDGHTLALARPLNQNPSS